MPSKLKTLAHRARLYALAGRNWLRFRRLSTEAIFTEMYQQHRWGDAETRSGSGSKLAHTASVREVLPRWLKQYQIASLLDIPCGDFNWLQQVNLNGARYLGADIVAALITENQQKYGSPHREFRHLDLIRDTLPAMEAVLCRDGLVHLSNADAVQALANIRASGAKYLIATTFNGLDVNRDIVTGFWRPVDLHLPPFELPPPLDLVAEMPVPHTALIKQIGLWALR